MTSAQAVFDYRNYKRVTAEDYIRNFMPFLDAHGVLPEFELRKDLLRLRKATSEAERVKILERLLYYPECCDLDFLKIAKDYVKNLETLKALNDRREAWDNRNAISEIK